MNYPFVNSRLKRNPHGLRHWLLLWSPTRDPWSSPLFYLGALQIDWIWPRPVWTYTATLEGPQGEVPAQRWTGRTRELWYVDFYLSIYLRSPGGFETYWSFGRV